MKKKIKISFNSPVILTFFIIYFISLALNVITRGYTNSLLFSVYHSSLLSIFTYFRFIGHVFGHGSWEHFISNMTLLLVVGPLLEEKYGSWNMITVILTTAIVTGIVNYVFFPHIILLGASGVVFALILLSSFTSLKEGEIPLTLILIAVIYIGGQIFDGIFIRDNVANFTHILGGVVGSIAGYVMNKGKTTAIV